MLNEVFDHFIEEGQLREEDLPCFIKEYVKAEKGEDISEQDCADIITLLHTINPYTGRPYFQLYYYQIRNLFVKSGFCWEDVLDRNGNIINRIKL